MFNFPYDVFTFRSCFPQAWLGLPTGSHEVVPLCWRRIGIEFPVAAGGLRPIILLSSSPKELAKACTQITYFGKDFFTKPHLPHHETEAVHVGLRAIGFSFVYFRCHVQHCSTYGSQDYVLIFGQAQVCHFDVPVS